MSRQISYKKQFQFLLSCIAPYKSRWSVYVIISIYATLTGVFNAIATRNLVDFATNQKMDQALLWGIIFGLLIISQVAANAITSYSGMKITQSLINTQQQHFIEHILRTQWFSINHYHSGDLQTRITNDVSQIVNTWMSTIPSILTFIFQFIGAFITLSVFDYRLALFAFVITPIALLISWFIGQQLKKFQSDIQKAESKYRSLINEILQHSVVIKTFQHETLSSAVVKRAQLNRQGLIIKQAKFNIASQLTIRLAFSLSFFAAFAWGAYRISLGLLTFGTFTAFIQLIGQIQTPMTGISRQLSQLLVSFSSVERILDIYDQPLEPIANTTSITNTPMIKTDLHIDQVSFGYTPTQTVINEASMDIPYGTHLVIIGESGAGKTTFIRLLLALTQPNTGTISISVGNNQPIPISSLTRGYFTYVPQGDTLFSGTIRENLLYGDPEASDELLFQALDAAYAGDFVRRTPDGLSSPLGENGIGLSQGQAQRLSIARALLRKTPILILDEATSGLDENSEREVLHRIQAYRQGMTCITITHRKTVYDLCDHIYQLSDGVFEKICLESN